MPRGANFTPDHQARAGRARAADPAVMAAIGAQGAQTTIARYGFDFLLRKLATHRRATPTAPEEAVAAVLASLGLVEGRDYERNLPVTVYDATGAPHTYELDFAVFGLRNIEADGGNWHTEATRAAHDQERDALLERAGWEVCRLPGRVLADADATRRTLVHFFRRTGGLDA